METIAVGKMEGKKTAADGDGDRRRKCKLEAAFKSMQQQQQNGPSPAATSDFISHLKLAGGSSGGRGSHRPDMKGKRVADEERKKREEIEFLVHLVCWGPNN